MDKEKLLKYILGQIDNEAERVEIADSIMSDRETLKEFKKLKNQISLWQCNGITDINREYKLFMKKQRGEKPVNSISLKSIFKYAAVIVLAVTITHFIKTDKKEIKPVVRTEAITYHKIKCPAGQISEIELADGTRVWLNSETTITYSNKFSPTNRQVEIKGEAYFDVVSNPESPFVVKTSKMDVKVLGTSFNVNAYPDESDIQVMLVEGKVDIYNKKSVRLAGLKPGYKADYSKLKNRLEVSKADTKLYTSWKQGKICFYNEKVADIVKRLERWYNVEICVDDKRINNLRFSGTILRSKPLDQVLRVMQLTMPVSHKRIIHNEKKDKIIIMHQRKN